MNAVAELVAEPVSGELTLFKSYTPLAVLTDQKVYSEFYQKLRQMTDAHEADVSTERGRKEIASLAYKVARSKTAIDEAGKKLTEDARAQIKAVDESRRVIRLQLDELKEEVRRPLTEWEQAEEAREERAKAELQAIREMGQVSFDDDAASVHARYGALDGMELDADLHKECIGVVRAARADAMAALAAAHNRLVREESERAELERLRAEAAERERIEAERKEQEAAAERAAAAEKAEQERLARLQQEAEARAKAEAERKAQEEREATERAHAEALAAERRRAEEAEAAAQAQRDRIAREEAERQAAVEREAAEQARREADRAHRGKIMGAAKEAIMEAGPVDEPIAKAIVLAIAAGSVPNISIRF